MAGENNAKVIIENLVTKQRLVNCAVSFDFIKNPDPKKRASIGRMIVGPTKGKAQKYRIDHPLHEEPDFVETFKNRNTDGSCDRGICQIVSVDEQGAVKGSEVPFLVYIADKCEEDGLEVATRVVIARGVEDMMEWDKNEYRRKEAENLI